MAKQIVENGEEIVEFVQFLQSGKFRTTAHRGTDRRYDRPARRAQGR